MLPKVTVQSWMGCRVAVCSCVRGGDKLQYSVIITVDCMAAGRVISEEEGNNRLASSST